MEQNPYQCGDSGCILRLPGVPNGPGANDGCRCLHDRDTETRFRVQLGIRWLTLRAAPDTYYRGLLAEIVDQLGELADNGPVESKTTVRYRQMALRGAYVTAAHAIRLLRSGSVAERP